MQLLAEHSEEGDCAGLGLVPARVVKLDPARMTPRLPIPHMGWSRVVPTRPSSLTDDLPDDARFYFVHSYVLTTDDPILSLLRATYGYDYIAAVGHGRVFGVQFHPEKSHAFGGRILRNFAEMSVA
jgi:glutamine amidotransferase